MNKISVALLLAAAVLLGPAAGVSVAKPGHGGPHGGGPHMGHPGYGGGAFRMNRGGGVPGYRGPGVRNWAYGSGNFRRYRGRGYAGFYPYYYGVMATTEVMGTAVAHGSTRKPWRTEAATGGSAITNALATEPRRSEA